MRKQQEGNKELGELTQKKDPEKDESAPEREVTQKEEKKKEPFTEGKISEKEVVQKKEPSSKPKIEKPKNCMRCNKLIKRKSWYYRNGKYYCSKGCWKLSREKVA